MMKYTSPLPDVQIAFSKHLLDLKGSILQEALFDSLKDADITIIDQELSQLVLQKDLQMLARYGLRGEVIFSVPYLLQKNPFLLGYYRLLLGFSQKSFYNNSQGLGFGLFSSMEKRGVINEVQLRDLSELCRALANSSSILLNTIDQSAISKQLFSELSLLTLGPQLRGARNNVLGVAATEVVFGIIKTIVSANVVESTRQEINLINAAGREISIRFAADPDIIITERFKSGNERNLIAIEIKGGTDYANAHNRLGEAEKSHQKAKLNGFTEFWTLTGFKVDQEIAYQESPTTSDFYYINDLMDKASPDYHKFRENIIGLTGIKDTE